MARIWSWQTCMKLGRFTTLVASASCECGGRSVAWRSLPCCSFCGHGLHGLHSAYTCKPCRHAASGQEIPLLRRSLTMPESEHAKLLSKIMHASRGLYANGMHTACTLSSSCQLICLRGRYVLMHACNGPSQSKLEAHMSVSLNSPQALGLSAACRKC